ncbi:MAG: formylglycine-generating enzyme family protein [Planctomycetota bacterium]|jgi:formylglycine-generating enzyme required for sulfatase activity
MPRCLHCNERYQDSLRRCPHCGAAPQEEMVPRPEAGAALGRLGAGEPLRDRYPPKRLAMLAVVVAFLGIAAVYAIPSGAPEQISVPDVDRQLSAGNQHRPQPSRQQKGIQPGKLNDRAVKVDEAVLIGDQVVIRGTIAPNAVTRVTLDGKGVPISADGSRFQVLRSRGKTSFDLGVQGIDGAVKTTTVLVELPDGPSEERVELAGKHDGQTYYEAEQELELAPGSRDSELKLNLDAVENFVRLGDHVIRLYRAPRGLVFLRVTESGHYAFLRLRDSQEVILVPAGISRRGSGEAPPHGPEHIVRMSAYLMDRSEVTGEQYAGFLEYMERVGDPSLRHREDRDTSLRPAGWDSHRCPNGKEHLPVTGVSWYGAFAYARWVGGRLPTEAQWERASAGPLGLRFPWGREYEPGRCVVEARGPAAARSMPNGAGPYGLLHASGNVREWCLDRFDPRWLDFAARLDPRGPAGHLHRVVRGGSFRAPAENLVLQFRDHDAPKSRKDDIGFRVAMPWPAKIR